MALISDALLSMEKVKLSDLTRISASADLATADYLPFNDASEGTDATRAVTIGAFDSYFKNNVNHIARTAVSGSLMPTSNVTTLSAANIRSTANIIANSLTAVSIDTGNLSANNVHANNSVSATTLSGKNIAATTLFGNVNIDSGTSNFGNVHIDGDLRVFGSTVTTSAQNLAVRDPIIEVAKDQTAPEVDFGILGNRGSSNNSAVIFDESADQWTVVYTTDDATTSGNITIASYADFKAHGGIFTGVSGDGSNITGLAAGNIGSGTFDNARVAESNVTQHEAALTILKTQVTDFDQFARTAVSGSSIDLTIGTTTVGGVTTVNSDGISSTKSITADNVVAHGSLSGVTVSGITFSGTQFIGGGGQLTDLNASEVEINSLTELAASGDLADADNFIIYDTSATDNKKVGLDTLKSYINTGAGVDTDQARTAVSGSDMVRLLSTTISGTNIRGTNIETSVLSGTQIFGGGANITALNATQLTSGSIHNARVSSGAVTQHEGDLSIAATQLASGSIPDARVPASNVTQHQAALTIAKSQVTDFDFFARTAVTGTAAFQSTQYVGTVYANLSGDASAVSGLTSGQIPSLAADKITSGTFDTGRIPDLDADKITSGTLGDARIPSLATSKITSGTFADARIAASNVTQHQASLTIAKTQVTDFDFFARSAVTGTSSFQSTQYVGTVYANLSGDASAVSGLTTGQIPSLATSKITSGTFADARIAESNVTQHEDALTILKTQVTDFDQFARTAVSGTLMPVSNVTTLSAANIRSTAGAIFNTVTAATLQVNSIELGANLSATNLHADNSVSATTVSARNISATTLFGQVDTDLNNGSGTSNFGNVLIEGDLRVLGDTIATSAENLAVRDPIIEVAKDQTAPEVDFGILGNRGSAQNSAVIYDESADQWTVIYTADDATTSGNVTIASYADFKAHGGIFVGVSGDGSNITGIAAGNIGSGTLANARVAESNVTQHEAALTLAASQIGSGTLADARVAESNVTQHQAALTIGKTQVTDFDFFARTAVTGTAAFQATQYVGTVYANLSGDASAVSGITASQIPNLDTGKITTGTFADARIAESNVTQHQSALALAATQLTSGSIPDARVPSSNVTQHQASLTIAKTQVTDFDFFARSAVTGTAAFQAKEYVGTIYANLSGDASSISGLQASQIPSLAADKITSGTFGADRIPSLATSKITSGTFADARIAESNVTQHEAALTIAKSQVTDFDENARTAVSGSNIVKIESTTVSASNIRADNVESASVSGTNVYAGNGVYIGGDTSANQLDNYVEGTWTPAFTLGSGSVGYATQSGYYTRIGNLVYATFEIELNSNTSAAGAMTIGGLPIAAANNAGGTGIGGVVAKHLKFETARDTLPSVVNVNLRVIKNTQTAEVVFSDDSVDVFQATGASLSSDTVIQGSFFYQA